MSLAVVTPSKALNRYVLTELRRFVLVIVCVHSVGFADGWSLLRSWPNRSDDMAHTRAPEVLAKHGVQVVKKGIDDPLRSLEG